MNFEDDDIHEDKEFVGILNRFEKMLRLKEKYFFDVMEYEDIIEYYLDMRKFDKALEAVSIGLTQHPNSISIKLKHVQILLDKGQPVKALKQLHEVQKFDTSNHEIYIFKGNAYCQLNRLQDAMKQYNRALHYTFENKDELLYSIALSFEQINQYKIAAKYLHEAYQINQKNLSVIYDLAYCYEKTDQIEKSITFYNIYLDHNPFSENVWYNLGILYNSIEDYEKAIESYDFAIAINKEYSSAYFNKANALINLNKYEEAITAYQDFTLYEKESPDAYCNIGECYEKLHKYDDAILFYRKALKYDNLNPDAWFGIGVVCLYKKQYKESIQYIKKAIGFDDDNSEYWYVLGNVYSAINNIPAAIKSFQFATDIDPFDYEAWLNYSSLYIVKKDIKKAIKILNEAYDTNADIALINYRLAAYHFLNRNSIQGLLYFEKGLAINFNDQNDFFTYYPAGSKMLKIRKLINTYKIKNK